MPALQVREFPEELYEELRAYAALHHRSMAQQTVAAVDRMIHGDAGGERSKGARVVSFESSAERERRLEKRRGIFARAEERRRVAACLMPEPSALLAEARAERDARFAELAAEIAGERR